MIPARHRARARWVKPASALGMALACLLLAVQAPRAEESARRKPSFTVSEYAYEHLVAAQEALQEGRIDAAREQLDALHAREGLSDHEEALLHQSYGYLEADAERFDEAIAHLEGCLAKRALPEAAQRQTLYNLSQLYVATERYADAVRTLREWIASEERPAPRAHYLLAVSHHQLGEVDAAIAAAALAVELADDPEEPWLQLLVALRLEREAYAAARAPLETLAERFPKKRYWLQLASLYAELEEERRSLALLELAHAEGWLDRDGERRRLARLYLYHGIPLRAAQVLERGLEDGTIEPDAEAWELLGNAWLRARDFERAAAPLARAAETAEDGRLWLRLAQTYAQSEQWDEALEALERALAKGGLEAPGRAQLLLGVTRFRLGRVEAARQAFARAARSERAGADARRWLEHLASTAPEREDG